MIRLYPFCTETQGEEQGGERIKYNRASLAILKTSKVRETFEVLIAAPQPNGEDANQDLMRIPPSS